MTQPQPSTQLLLYQTEDGQTRIQLRSQDGSIWLSQKEIAELFGTTVVNINTHTSNILKEEDLNINSVIKDSLITAADGKNYPTKIYRLDMILAIGYRVKSHRGTQFRRWATEHLKTYLTQDFLLDDERFKFLPPYKTRCAGRRMATRLPRSLLCESMPVGLASYID